MARTHLQPRVFLDLFKHRKGSVRDWESGETLVRTINGDSQFNPHLPLAEQHKLEELCIDEGHAYRESADLCKYYKKVDVIVGACSGELTSWIFAEWKSTGDIHGRPISTKRLRQMQVKIDD